MSEEDDATRRADAAAKRAAVLFERQQQGDPRVADKEKRHSDWSRRPPRVRKRRFERDAAEAEAAKASRSRRAAADK
jgi:hypothetical protein